MSKRVDDTRKLEMDEMKLCFLGLIVLSAVFSVTDTIDAAITVKPIVAIALINDSTFLNCSTTSEEVEWLFESDQYSQFIIYSYGAITEPYKHMFRVDHYTHNYTKFFNLILHSVTKEDGGLYVCKDPTSQNDEARKVHLTVLETEPVCESNLNLDGPFGPNSCTLNPETVQLSCSVRFSGNQFPELQWIKSGENIAINSSMCKDSGNTYTCNLTMESELQMEGSSYVCQTTQSMTGQYNCTSDVFRIMCDGIPIVGTVVGILAAVIVICVIAFILWKVIRRKKNIENRQSISTQAEPMLTIAEQKSEASTEQDPPGRDQMPQKAGPDRGNNILRTITPQTEGNENKRVRGITILNDKLLVVFELSANIEIFTTDISSSDRLGLGLLEVNDLKDPGSIAACTRNKCLYIMDHRRYDPRRKIFKVKPDGRVMKIWDTDNNDEGRISVNRDGNVVMTVCDKHALKMYSPDGQLLKENTIDFSGNTNTYILHAINLADGNFILGQGIDSSAVHQVCKIDATRNVLRSFGNTKGSGDAQLSCPAYLAERKDGSILVADQGNHRIILLSSKLKFKAVLFTKENDGVSCPEAMSVYEKNKPALLFLGCNTTSNTGGKVLVLRLGQ